MPRRKKSSLENHSRSSGTHKEKPQQRYAANARERARMRVLSRAFCRLKTTLPWVPADTKLSKLDTLRLAGSYIAHLKGILRNETLGSSESSLHPAMSMTWPFGFNRPLGGSTGGGSQEGGSLEGSEDDMDDMDDGVGDNDDGESISSCTWEEVSPVSSSASALAKDCVHLDTPTTPRRHVGGGGRTRGKGNSSNLVQVRGKESNSSSSPSTFFLNKQNLSPTNNNNQEHLNNKNTHQNNTLIRPLSQIQHHHPHHISHEAVMFPHPHSQYPHQLDNKLPMTVTENENAPPPTSQNDGMMEMGNGLFGRDMGDGDFGQQQHDLHHHLNHGDDGGMHNVHSDVYGFSSSDLISIG